MARSESLLAGQSRGRSKARFLRETRKHAQAAWQRLKWWREPYADALAKWPTDPNVEFPIGTYKHRVYHGAKVSATAPPGL